MIKYLLELRGRLLKIICFFGLSFLLFFHYSNTIFSFLINPLLQVLGSNKSLIATQITSPVLLPIQLAFDLAILFTIPYAFYETWKFLAPGLYYRERGFLKKSMIASFGLFCLGTMFCLLVVLPFLFHFFVGSTPHGVQLLPDMLNTLNFITRMILLFGFCFQLPLLCHITVKLGLVDLATLKKIRPYMIVFAFILGMILTPPDVLSQILLALPLCLLYELGIIFAAFGKKF